MNQGRADPYPILMQVAGEAAQSLEPPPPHPSPTHQRQHVTPLNSTHHGRVPPSGQFVELVQNKEDHDDDEYDNVENPQSIISAITMDKAMIDAEHEDQDLPSKLYLPTLTTASSWSKRANKETNNHGEDEGDKNPQQQQPQSFQTEPSMASPRVHQLGHYLQEEQPEGAVDQDVERYHMLMQRYHSLHQELQDGPPEHNMSNNNNVLPRDKDDLETNQPHEPAQTNRTSSQRSIANSNRGPRRMLHHAPRDLENHKRHCQLDHDQELETNGERTRDSMQRPVRPRSSSRALTRPSASTTHDLSQKHAVSSNQSVVSKGSVRSSSSSSFQRPFGQALGKRSTVDAGDEPILVATAPRRSSRPAASLTFNTRGQVLVPPLAPVHQAQEQPDLEENQSSDQDNNNNTVQSKPRLSRTRLRLKWFLCVSFCVGVALTLLVLVILNLMNVTVLGHDVEFPMQSSSSTEASLGATTPTSATTSSPSEISFSSPTPLPIGETTMSPFSSSPMPTTGKPSMAPSLRPTKQPTAIPSTFVPSSSPMSSSSSPPPLLGGAAEAEPTLQPSLTTAVPTDGNPTASPSLVEAIQDPFPLTTPPSGPPPTSSPTLSPTQTAPNPTPMPTVMPTTPPPQTLTPTVSPVFRSTPPPTGAPSTVEPTKLPSPGPTLEPTDTPTRAPTPIPTSSRPTPTPTVPPTTLVPTTMAPTRSPTMQPSSQTPTSTPPMTPLPTTMAPTTPPLSWELVAGPFVTGGTSVALVTAGGQDEEDNGWMVLGEPLAGQVQVYRQPQPAAVSSWTSVATITNGGGGTTTNGFGTALDLARLSSSSSSSSTRMGLLVGAPQTPDVNNVAEFGSVAYYELDTGAAALGGSSSWTRVGSIQTPPSIVFHAGGEFGAAVSLSASPGAPERPRFVVAAPQSGGTSLSQTKAGKIYTYQYNEAVGDWELATDEPLVGTAGSRLGSSVALSRTGERLVAGAPTAAQGNGSLVYYDWKQETRQWDTLETILGGPDEALGTSVTFLTDSGTVLAVGAPTSNATHGAIRVYQRLDEDHGGGLEKLGSDLVGTEPGQFVGRTLCGTQWSSSQQQEWTLVVAFGTDTGSFHVYYYSTSDQDWVPVAAVAPEPPSMGSAIVSLALSDTADTVVVGLANQQTQVYQLQ